MTPPRPCLPAEAVSRALLLVGRPEIYVLGTGTYQPRPHEDLPFTRNARGYGCDCWGLAGSWCFRLPRHRMGYNKGPWATVTDDINTDSAIEQAEHPTAKDRLWEVVDRPALGDLLVYPSIRDKAGKRIRIGHVGIITGLCAEWDPKAPQYGLLEVVQCQASRKPAIMKGPGTGWLMRDTFKGLRDDKWRTRMLRAVSAAQS